MSTPQSAIDVSSFAATQGRPIHCHAWQVHEAHATWSPSNVHFDEVEIPVPAASQVRVKMYAAGLNPADPGRTTFGAPPTAPSAEEVTPPHHPPPNFPFPYVCGIDGAGVIESVGWDSDAAAASPLRVGDRVAFLADLQSPTGGTLAEYAVVDADLIAKIPDPQSPGARTISLTEAAALPAAPGTAYLCLFYKLHIQRGKSIFISGASGGVGSAAVQLAKHAGLRVFASCSRANVPFVEALGADCVLDYTTVDVVEEILKRTGGVGVEYLLESAPAKLTEAHCDALCFSGSACVITGLVVPTTPAFFMRQLSIHYVFLGMLHRSHLRPELQKITEELLKLYQTGALTIAIEEVPLSQAPEALDRTAKCHTRGKTVLTAFHAE